MIILIPHRFKIFSTRVVKEIKQIFEKLIQLKLLYASNIAMIECSIILTTKKTPASEKRDMKIW
jgi:hypothetical protein